MSVHYFWMIVVMCMSHILWSQNGKAVLRQDVGFTFEDRERMKRIEMLLEQHERKLVKIETLLEQYEKTLVKIEALLDQHEKRLDSVEENLKWQFGILIAGMFTLVGFILWDRRTYVKSFENRASDIERQLKLADEKIEKVVSVLKDFAQKNHDLEESMQKHRML